jgi:excisionase family DNA binding protein
VSLRLQDDSGKLLNPGEVAGLLRVDARTVTRWAIEGKIESIRTPGGHRRFLQTQVLAMRGQIDEDEIRLRTGDITVICDALSRGPDPDLARERIGKFLSEASIGSLIRVTA